LVTDETMKNNGRKEEKKDESRRIRKSRSGSIGFIWKSKVSLPLYPCWRKQETMHQACLLSQNYWTVKFYCIYDLPYTPSLFLNSLNSWLFEACTSHPISVWYIGLCPSFTHPATSYHLDISKTLILIDVGMEILIVNNLLFNHKLKPNSRKHLWNYVYL
jgi:hypothetical protein